jgi:hypothetical protein
LKGLDTVISEQLKDHSRNLKNVLTYLEEKHKIKFCKKTLRNYLKDNGLYLGRARLSIKSKQNDFELKQQQIESLKKLEDSEYIDLYFGDESYFGLMPNVPYAWQTKESPKLLPAAKGKFLYAMGLMNRNNDLFFERNEATFNTNKFILFVDKFADKIVKRTIVILYNSSIHQSKKFMTKIRERKEKDFFFLPPNSSELELIEILCQKTNINGCLLSHISVFRILKNDC